MEVKLFNELTEIGKLALILVNRLTPTDTEKIIEQYFSINNDEKVKEEIEFKFEMIKKGLKIDEETLVTFSFMMINMDLVVQSYAQSLQKLLAMPCAGNG